MLLHIYQACMKHIQKLKPKDLEHDYLQIPKELILSALQYIFTHKLRYSYHQFTQLVDEIMSQHLEAECYVNFLDLECTLYRFYHDVKQNLWFTSTYHEYQSLKKRITNFDKAVGNPPAINLLNGQELEKWVNEQIKKYNPRNFDKEFKQLQKQIKATSQAKKQDKTMAMPIFYENEEIVLYIF